MWARTKRETSQRQTFLRETQRKVVKRKLKKRANRGEEKPKGTQNQTFFFWFHNEHVKKMIRCTGKQKKKDKKLVSEEASRWGLCSIEIRFFFFQSKFSDFTSCTTGSKKEEKMRWILDFLLSNKKPKCEKQREKTMKRKETISILLYCYVWGVCDWSKIKRMTTRRITSRHISLVSHEQFFVFCIYYSKRCSVVRLQNEFEGPPTT